MRHHLHGVVMRWRCSERASDTRVARYGVYGSARYLNLEGLILQGTMESFVLVKRYCVIESKLDIGLREGNWRFVGYTGMMQTVLWTNMIGIDNTQSCTLACLMAFLTIIVVVLFKVTLALRSPVVQTH